MKFKIILIFAMIFVSNISFALEPGKLYINDVFIPFEKTVEKPEELEQAKSTFYIYANGQRIAKKENNKLYYFYNDHLGSPRAISDDKGNIVWEADYQPFGEVFNEQGSNNVKYNSKELDKDTKLHYYGARYYLDDIGRFITADTVEVFPNAYVYVANNPLKFVDPDGNQKEGLSHAVMLIGEPKWFEKPFAYLFSDVYVKAIAKRMNIKNLLVIKSATKKHFFQLLKDEGTENIILLGHGGWMKWHAKGESLDQQDIRHFLKKNKIEQKKNLFRFTCGPGRGTRKYTEIPEDELRNEYMEKVNEKARELEEKYGDLGSLELSKKRLEFYYPFVESLSSIYSAKIDSVKQKSYETKIEEQIGTGVFKNIYGWERKTTPLDFLINPYHKEE